MHRADFLPEIHSEQHVVVYGLHQPQYIESLLQQKSLTHVLIYEFDEAVYQQALPQIANWQQDNRLTVFFGSEPERYIRELEKYFMADILRFCRAGATKNFVPHGRKLTPEFEKMTLHFANSYQAALQNILVYANDDKEDAWFGLVNTLKNLRGEKYYTVQELQGLVHQHPVVIIGSGPSLTPVLPFLHKSQHKLIIIACDSVVTILQKNKIRPDFICCLERICEMKSFFKKFTDRTIPLIAPTHLYPEAIQAYPGPIVFMPRDAGFDGYFLPATLTRHAMGISVGQMCFSLALWFEAPTIYMIGFDAAFDPETHAMHQKDRAVVIENEESWLKNESQVTQIEVPGHDGQPKKTQSFWLLDVEQYERMIDMNATKSSTKYFRVLPKKFGIPIHGVTQIEPDVAGDQWIALNSVDKKNICDLALKAAYSGDFIQRRRQKAIQTCQEGQAICVNALNDMTQFFYQNQLILAQGHVPYSEFLATMNQTRCILFRDEFYLLIANLLQGLFARTGFAYSQTMFDTKISEKDKVIQHLKIFRQWFTECLAILIRIQKQCESLD